MPAFGIDLARRSSATITVTAALPYALLILIAIGLQYLQMRQLNSRNPAMAQANPQAQMMQRYMPLIFAVIYISIAAGVNVYFIVSSLCRIGIQEAMFRSGVLDKAPTRREGTLAPRDGGGASPRRSMHGAAHRQRSNARSSSRRPVRRASRASWICLEPPRPAPSKIPRHLRRAAPTGTAPPRPAGAKPPGTKPPGANHQGTEPPVTKPQSGAATSNGDGCTKWSGQAERSGQAPPSGASSNGGARGGSPKAGSNGAPAPKGQPQGQPDPPRATKKAR